jgi:exodeoxyribonuclease VII large subunit
MNQLPLFETQSWTVTDLTRYLRELIEGDFSLQDLWVFGEVSNLSRPSSGHLYFTLKDANATLRCVMWRDAVRRQPVIPQEGEAIEVHGGLGLYEAGGVYQLYADTLRPAGEGVLYQEFLRLKARLEAEGLFDVEHKQPLPEWPRRVGVITSPTGAALRDMLNTIHRRYPAVEVIVTPAPVQGEAAPTGIVNALADLNRIVHPDVILLARGGGSIEDMWAFNDERVARAILASEAPVITGVGHETDFTIADFTADVRAPTPTAAAELATPNRDELLKVLAELQSRLDYAWRTMLDSRRWSLNAVMSNLRLLSPAAQVRRDRQRLDEFVRRAEATLEHRLRVQRTQLEGLDQRLAALNPLSVLNRGYAIVSQPDGSVVRSVAQVNAGDELNVRVGDGEFGVRATDRMRTS